MHTMHSPAMFATLGRTLVGDEALSKRGILTIRHPIEGSLVTNWDHMESLWHHIFLDELRCAPEAHALLLTEPLLHPKESREKMVRLMFETFHVPALCVASSPALALRASGRATGVVLDLGSVGHHAVPVHEGCVLAHAIPRPCGVDGRGLTDHMQTLLLERGYAFTTAYERVQLEQITETLTFVAVDYDAAMAASATVAGEAQFKAQYELPDGQIVTLFTERFRCAEALFQPILAGRPEGSGLHQMVFDAVSRCDASLHAELLGNVVLTGGAGAMPGLAERLRREVSALAAADAERLGGVAPHVHVSAPPSGATRAAAGSSTAALSTPPADPNPFYDALELPLPEGVQGITAYVESHAKAIQRAVACEHSAWLGGSRLASEAASPQRWLTAQEYEAHGPASVHAKCW